MNLMFFLSLKNNTMKIADEIRNVSLLKYVLFQCAHTLEKNTNDPSYNDYDGADAAKY